MNSAQILNVFYNEIVPEAKIGKVNCYFTINLVFNLNMNNKLVSECSNLSYSGIFVPTLKISDKELFDFLLVKYVKKALKIYHPKEFSFLDDLSIADVENLKKVKERYTIRYIITTLFANASYLLQN